jgi:hypothetical protein
MVSSSVELWVDKMKRLYAHIPILPLEDLRALPEAGDFDAGVYFLWLRDDLQYIGKSRQICYRLQLQEQSNLYGGIKRIPFDRHTCIVVEGGRVRSDDLDDRLKPLERAYIAHYQPPFNFIGENPGT